MHQQRAVAQISALQPPAWASMGWPGTAMTRVLISAQRAVIRLPELPSPPDHHHPRRQGEMMQLRAGMPGDRFRSGGCSEILAVSQIDSSQPAFEADG